MYNFYSLRGALFFGGWHPVTLLMMLGLVGQTIVGGGIFDDAFSPVHDLLVLFKERSQLFDKLALVSIKLLF